ncbi:MAG: winged helix-turn-helix transcriptional regulator [Candidatus Saliniplasma sp.]
MKTKIDDFTEGPTRNSKSFTEGPTRNSKTIEFRMCIIRELARNNIDLDENPLNYILLKDIAEELDKSRSTISYHINRMEDKGLISLNRGKTKLFRSATLLRGKIYTVTTKGKEFYKKFNGGSFPEFESFTGGPNSKFECIDLHGDLIFRMNVLSLPDKDYFDWDRINTLRNGVEHKYKTVEGPRGQKCTIELFKGKNRSTVTLKPSVTASPDPKELMRQADKLAWYFHRYLSKAGYDLDLPERKGEGKFSVVSDKFKDIKIPDGPNHKTDNSPKDNTIHPRTGDIESNAEMAKMLTDTGYMAQASKKIDRLENKVDKQAQVITRMTNVINDLVDQLGGVGEQLQQYDNQTDPGGRMYG